MLALRRTAVALATAVVALLPAAPASADLSPVPLGSSAASTLDAQVAEQTAGLADATRSLEQVQAAATRALEQRQAAERAAQAAQREADTQAALLREATAAVETSRAGLARFAGALYRRGSGGPRMSSLAGTLLRGDSGGAMHDLEVAERVGDGKAQAYEQFRSARTAQAAATSRSRAASSRAVTARAAAVRAQADAEQAVRAQADVVARQQQELARTQDAAAVAHRREELLARAEQLAQARSRVAVPASALAGASVPRPVGSCQGSSLAGYPNGMLPESALCPLWGTTGQVLRADAAAAFYEMSRAYAAETGEPLCVTDSYRSYPEQVAVRAAKPTLAAVPGTSNHGWGVALDLCGGVETFGSPAHRWMQEHAAASGWFHPAWAQQGGSKPEAWHWEYAG